MTHTHTHTHTLTHTHTHTHTHTFLFSMAQQPHSGRGLLHYRGFTITHTTFGGTALDEWSTRRRDLYLITNTHKRQTDRHPCLGGVEPMVPASERPQTHALDRAGTGIGNEICILLRHWFRTGIWKLSGRGGAFDIIINCPETQG